MGGNPGLLAALTSFFLPGAGQALQGRTRRGIWFLLAFLAVWLGPTAAVDLHLLLSAEIDPLLRRDLLTVVRPYAWTMRAALHLFVSYDAWSFATGADDEEIRTALGEAPSRRRRRQNRSQ